MEMERGDLPKKALELVREWLSDHQDELQEMWDKQQIRKLPPLENPFRIIFCQCPSMTARGFCMTLKRIWLCLDTINFEL